MGDNSSYSNAQLRCPTDPDQSYIGIDAPSANCSTCFLKRRAHISPDNSNTECTSAPPVAFGPIPKAFGAACSSLRLLCPNTDTSCVPQRRVSKKLSRY
jgi:hypothetical protein